MRHVALFILAAFVALAGCDGCSDSDDGSGVWAKPTKLPTENCEGCTEVELDGFGHGVQGTVLQDLEVDDELVQWSGCLHSYMDCVDGDGAYDECIRQAECPQACKDAVFARYSGTDDYDAHAAAIEAVFMTEGGLCTPDEVPGMVEEPEEVTP